jgi:hypothetical protein
MDPLPLAWFSGRAIARSGGEAPLDQKQARRDDPLHQENTLSDPPLIFSIAMMIRSQVSARPGSTASPQPCTPKMM